MSHASAFDFSSAATGVLFLNKPITYLSPWIAKSHAAAQEDGRHFAVLTPGTAAISLPLSMLLSEPGCQWLATSADGTFFDGFTGRVHSWNGEVFEPLDELAEDFLLTPRTPGGLLHVRAETMHPASLGTRIGDFTAQLFTELTGHPPVGWGRSEPVSEPWDTAAITAHCYDRAPEASVLLAVGQPRVGTAAASIAVVTVERSAAGVHESVELLAESADPLGSDQLEAFAARMHRSHARTAVLGHAVGFSNLARPARFTGMSVPACAFFGSEALQDFGARQALAAAGPRARLIGVPPVQSLAVNYAQEPASEEKHPLEAWAELAGKLSVQLPG